MTLATVEQRQFGLKKESTRGAAEAAPAKWYPVMHDVQFTYGPTLIEDEAVRGIPERFPPILGARAGTGKVKMPLDAQTLGEFLHSLLGNVSSAPLGGAAHKHTFTYQHGLQKPSYTFFLDRGLSIKKYNLGVVKKMALNGPVDGLILAEADTLFKSEAEGAMGTPSFPNQQYLAFQSVSFKIAGQATDDVKTWQLTLDNTAQVHRTQARTLDIQDILTPGKLDVKGGFLVYFQDEGERNKFLTNTQTSLEILMEGNEISSGFRYSVAVTLPRAHYKAYPYGEDNKLLAANAEFEGFFDSVAGKSIQVDVVNADPGY